VLRSVTVLVTLRFLARGIPEPHQGASLGGGRAHPEQSRAVRGVAAASPDPRSSRSAPRPFVTEWDWADPKAYLHDQVSTDKRHPTVNAYGKHFGATEESREYFPVFDPQQNRPTTVNMPVREAGMETSKSATMAPSAYWGERPDSGPLRSFVFPSRCLIVRDEAN
jgi:hypothetical protein